MSQPRITAIVDLAGMASGRRLLPEDICFVSNTYDCLLVGLLVLGFQMIHIFWKHIRWCISSVSYIDSAQINTTTTTTTIVLQLSGFCLKPKPVWNSWSKRQWVAVVSAGSYANLHLAPDR